MKFMMFMIPRVYQPETLAAERAGEGFAPPPDAVENMMKFNGQLAKTGALIGLDGLHPVLKGARVKFAKGKPAVTDGPFIESKEVIGGYWLINANSNKVRGENQEARRQHLQTENSGDGNGLFRHLRGPGGQHVRHLGKERQGEVAILDGTPRDRDEIGPMGTWPRRRDEYVKIAAKDCSCS